MTCRIHIISIECIFRLHIRMMAEMWSVYYILNTQQWFMRICTSKKLQILSHAWPTHSFIRLWSLPPQQWAARQSFRLGGFCLCFHRRIDGERQRKGCLCWNAFSNHCYEILLDNFWNIFNAIYDESLIRFTTNWCDDKHTRSTKV